VGACGDDHVTPPEMGPEVASVTMRPPQLYMDSLDFGVGVYAIAYDERGNRLFSSVQRPEEFSWSSSAGDVASVDHLGTVTSLSWGTGSVTATHQSGVSGTTRVRVRDAVDLAWTIPDMGKVRAGIAIGLDGTIYVPTRKRLFAISPGGQVLWSLETPGGLLGAVLGTPAIAEDGTLYFGSVSSVVGGLTALAPDGTIIWEVPDLGGISSSPTIGPDGTIYVGSSERRVYAVDPQGEILWTYEAADRFNFASAAVANDGTIYVGGSENQLHAINPDGTQRWVFEADDQIQRSPVIGPDGTIYFGAYDLQMYAVNPDGTERWRLPVHVNSTPAFGADGTIYVAGWGIHAISPGGSVLWTYAPNGGAIQPIVGANGTIYVANTNGLVISALDAQGMLLWDYPTGRLAGGPPALALDGTILATSEEGTLFALVDHESGGGFEAAAWPKEHGNRANTGRSGG
jgi:outer membrane protein assembly factor BamB